GCAVPPLREVATRSVGEVAPGAVGARPAVGAVDTVETVRAVDTVRALGAPDAVTAPGALRPFEAIAATAGRCGAPATLRSGALARRGPVLAAVVTARGRGTTVARLRPAAGAGLGETAGGALLSAPPRLLRGTRPGRL